MQMSTHAPTENPPELFNIILKNWHFVIVILGFIVSLVYSWSHFESAVRDLQQKELQNQIQANSLSASVQQITPEISSINAKLDILLKHNGL